MAYDNLAGYYPEVDGNFSEDAPGSDDSSPEEGDRFDEIQEYDLIMTNYQNVSTFYIDAVGAA